MILDCKTIANNIKSKLLSENKNLRLAILHYGLDNGQSSYIKNIVKISKGLNIDTEILDLKTEFPSKLSHKLTVLNNISVYNAILPIRPFPSDIDTCIRDNINLIKDVDNFSSKSNYTSCTAEGVLEILNFHNIDYVNKKVLIIGRNEGRNIFDLLLKNNATCTLAHSKTPNLSKYTSSSDIIITSTGQKCLITNDIVNDNTIIIDVGRNEVSEEMYARENVLVTPRVSGTGLITTMKLMEHIYKAYSY